MTDIPTSFLIFCVLSLAFTIWGIAAGHRVFEIPVLISAFNLAWLVPQGIAVESGSWSSDFLDEMFWVYVTLCMVLLTIGFYFGKGRKPVERQSSDPIITDRLIILAGAFLAIGLVAQYLVISSGADTEAAQWTGIITAYYMLLDFRTYAICLAVLAYARTKNKAFLIIAAIGIIAVIPGLGNSVKRTQIFEFLIATGGAYMFAKRIIPPRAAVFAVVFLGTLLLHQVGTIRDANRNDRALSEVLSSGELIDGFEYFELEKTRELLQAKSDFRYLSESGEHKFFATYWNQLTHQYVPAFVFGRDFKQSLRLATLGDLAAEEREGLYYSFGSTRTGFSDSFEAFRYFGAIVFLLIGFMGGIVYRRALEGRTGMQFLYLMLISQYMIVISHSTSMFFSAIPLIFLATLAFHWYVRVPGGKSGRFVRKTPSAMRRGQALRQRRMSRLS